MGLIDDEISQWKRSFALLSTINPANDAFDPARRDSAELLAGIAPWAIAAPLSYGLLGRDDGH